MGPGWVRAKRYLDVGMRWAVGSARDSSRVDILQRDQTRMAKRTKGKAPQVVVTGQPAGFAASLKRVERNRARREQRARVKRAKEAAKNEPTLTNVVQGPKYDAAPEPFLPPVEALKGSAATAGPSPSLIDEYADRLPGVHGTPRMDADLRLGRRSTPTPWDGKTVYDVQIVRATDNAVMRVKGLSENAAQELMIYCVRMFADLVSVERFRRVEY